MARNQILVDRYRLVSEPFRGAFAQVFKAADLRTEGRFVAIMFDGQGRCVLIDWNLANLPDVASNFTRSLGGTRGYIDPWVVNKDYDAAADIYSFAITMAEAASGKPPELLVPEFELQLAAGD